MTDYLLEIIRKSKNLGTFCPENNQPEWLTPKYAADCMKDEKLQDKWKPKEGDWFFCRDIRRFSRINSLEAYFSEGDEIMRLPSDVKIGSAAKSGCDYFIPDPKNNKRLKAKTAKKFKAEKNK